jgi:hypothetical protein
VIYAALALLYLFNLPSLIANLIYARRQRWALAWLNAVLLFQVVAIFVPIVPVLYIISDSVETEIALQRIKQATEVIDAGIKANDSAVIEQALNHCGESCTTEQLDRFLLNAVREGAHSALRYLLSRGAYATPANVHSSVQTCDGIDLGDINSLAMSVALDDVTAFGLLLPKSDDQGRQQAAWVAAQRDRLDLLQRLLEMGVPLSMHATIGAGSIDATITGAENATLLDAAASGAALRVGSWLLEEKGFNAAGDTSDAVLDRPASIPLLSLINSARYQRDPSRVQSFLSMLMAHGAHLDLVFPENPLQLATWASSPAVADALIAAGASESLLTDKDRDRLATLRQNPPTLPSGNDCLP